MKNADYLSILRVYVFFKYYISTKFSIHSTVSTANEMFRSEEPAKRSVV